LQRYQYHDIGRYGPDAAMARGLADLIPASGYAHGATPTAIDAHTAGSFRRRAREYRAALPQHQRGNMKVLDSPI
jgi:hypothetical protein